MPDLIKALMAAGVMRTAHESLTDNEVGVVAAALGREISVTDRE
jgi:hypothetical protein